MMSPTTFALMIREMTREGDMRSSAAQQCAVMTDPS
jgi:hypothetical protein